MYLECIFSKMAESEGKSQSVNRLAEDGGFKDRTLLLTGGTGFMGKVLVEKILRTCPLIKRIYIIIRNKKGKDPQERLRQIYAGPVSLSFY